jgi:hypothetical protein
MFERINFTKSVVRCKAATLPILVVSWRDSFVPHDVELCEKRPRAPPLERTCILSATRLEAEHLVQPQCCFVSDNKISRALVLKILD